MQCNADSNPGIVKDLPRRLIEFFRRECGMDRRKKKVCEEDRDEGTGLPYSSSS